MKLEIILPIIILITLVIIFYFIRKNLKEKKQLVNLEILEENMIEYTPTISPLTLFESELLDLINYHRIEIGFNGVLPELKCRELADEHTLYMISEGKPSHDLLFKRRFSLFRRGAQLFGENVAFGYSTPKSLFKAYMKSDGHKKIIETEGFTHIGIRAQKDKGNKYYNALIFAKF